MSSSRIGTSGVKHGYRLSRTRKSLARDVAAQLEKLKTSDITGRQHVWTSRPSPASIDGFSRTVQDVREHQLLREPSSAPLSANHGYTVAVKDNIVTTSLPSSCASNILRGYVAPRKATVVELMEKAGMAVMGKTNMDEFGMGSHSINTPFGIMSQQYTRLSVGGSSGGSALAVASQHSHMALGTDTGGSVRLPAAYMSLFGFKPSYGMISRYGVVPYANSLDTVGILGNHPLDVWLLYNILSHPDEKDPTCLSEPTRRRIESTRALRTNNRRQDPIRAVRYVAKPIHPIGTLSTVRNGAPLRDAQLTHKAMSRDLGARRIGIPTDYNIAELQPEVRTAWRNTIALLRELGHDIVPIELPTTRHALSAYYILAPAEASSNLAKYDGVRYGAVRSHTSAQSDDGVLYSSHRGSLFGEEVKRRILLGAFSLSAGAMDNYFLQAQRIRRLVQKDFNQVFRMPHPLLEGAEGVENGVDLILCPTAPTTPPKIEHVQQTVNPVETYMNDVFTVPASLAGLPAYSFPAPPPPGERLEGGDRSVGMQIIGQYGDDLDVLQFVRNKIFSRSDWDFNSAGNRTREGPQFKFA